MPLNAILAALLNEFSNAHTLTNLKESEQFEHFVNYSLLSDIYGEDFNIQDISTGNQEFGLDGLAVLVNNNIVDDIDEVDDLAKKNKFLECEFVFTQAKTASAFDSGDMLKTLFAVQDFFGSFNLLQGSRVKHKYSLKEHIYTHAPLFRRGAPSLRVFYVSAGSWQADPNLMAVIEQSLEKLRQTGLFSHVQFAPLDAAKIQQLYFRSKNAVRKQINFPRNVPLPVIDGVREAYIGLLPALEYLKLVEGENGAIKKQVFFDNMRDYMADSDTNKEIAATLSSEKKSEFPLRNNGITVVARDLQRVSDTFTVEDYQIVNGCQTSHVLFNSKGDIDPTVFVPVKIIVTEDDDITTSIIRGSNFSNQFDSSQLWATEPFHKDLEIFFGNHQVNGEQLFYERRKGQYGGMSDAQVEKVRIVTPQGLLKNFASTFLERPHDVTKYFSALEPEVGKSIFVSGHSPHAYFAAAMSAFRLESLFRNKRLPSEFKPVRNHLVLGFKHATVSEPIILTERDTEKKLKHFFEVVGDQNASAELFMRLIAITESAQTVSGTDNLRSFAKSVALRDVMRVEGSKLLTA